MADYGLLIEVSSKGINKVDSELKSLNKTMEQTAKSSDKVEKGLSSTNVNKFSQSVKQANSEVSSLNNSFKSLGSLITAGAIIGVGKACISSAQEVASLKAQIRSLGEDVDTTYKSLKEFSLTTAGLNTEGVVKAYASFKRLGYSTDEAKSNIQALGKGLASFGTTEGMSAMMMQMEQLSNRTSAFTQDLNAISNYLMDAKSVVKDTFKVDNIEDLEKLGVTGKDVANALIQNYSKLSAPQDDINMQMNRLNSTIQDIKASAGEVFAGFVPQLQKIGNVLKYIAETPMAQSVASGVAQTLILYSVLSKVKTKTDEIISSMKSMSNLNQGVATNSKNINVKTPEQLYNARIFTGFKKTAIIGKIKTSEQERALTKKIYDTGTNTLGFKEELGVLKVANKYVKEAQGNLNKVTAELQREFGVGKSINDLQAEKVRRQTQINTLSDKLLATSRMVANTEDERIRKENTLLKLEQQIVAQRDKILSINRNIALIDTQSGARGYVGLERAIRNQQIGNVFRGAGNSIKSGVKSVVGNIDGNLAAIMIGSTVSAQMDKVLEKYSAITNPLNVSIDDLRKVTQEQVKEYRSAKIKQALGNGLTTAASVSMMTGSWQAGLVSGAASSIYNIYDSLVGEVVADRQRNEILTDDALLKSSKGYKRGLELQKDDDTALEGQKLEAQATLESLKRRQGSQKEVVDEIKGRNWWGQLFSHKGDEEAYLDSINSKLSEQENIVKNITTQQERQNRLKNKTDSIKDRDLTAEISSMKYKQVGDEYNSQLVLIQRNYQKIIENEKASEKEKEKALLTLQEQTRELKNQQELKNISESGAIKESNFTLQGNKYQAEITKAETEYLQVCKDINSSIADRQVAYNNYAIAVNKANLNEYGRNANLESAKSKYFGYESDIDIMKEYYMTVNDMTSTIQEKETAWYTAKLGLLNKAIDKVKTYYSTYMEGIKSVISKRREMTDSVLSELQRQKDGENSILSEGQAAYLSSGSFDLGNKDSKNYSNEDIMSAYNKVMRDKQDKENLNNQIDAVLYGSNNSTQGLENMMKSYENMQKYLNDNKTQGLELYKMLSQYLPKLEQTYNLLNNQAQRQMNY